MKMTKSSALHGVSRSRLKVLLAACALILTSITEASAEPVQSALPAEVSPRAAQGLLLDVVASEGQLTAVGERGNVVSSKDGKRWSQSVVPVRSALTAVVALGANQMWAVGHDAAIVHSVDAGKSWTLQHYDPAKLQPLHDVLFLDRSHGVAVGAFGLMLTTQDAGTTWSEVNAPAVREDGAHLNALARLGNGEVVVVGEQGLVGISNDGRDWDRLQSPYEGSYFGVVARGERGAVIFGLRGNAYASDDVRSGTWRRIDLSTTSSIFGGASVADGSVILVGADSAVIRIMPSDIVERISAKGSTSNSGTIAAVAPWGGEFIAVGENGICATRTCSR
ncbi:MAG: YCF48-related protein [Pseudomonadota bacterium]|nr:YCF48-related protein [Pseudomonadota bacterium]